MSTPDITFYGSGTSNGIKISIVLEELGLAYTKRKIDLTKNEQKEPWFLKINPNGRIPAITDGSLNVWESGSILQYLVHKYDPEHRISYAPGTAEWAAVNNWLFFQHGGIGPMQGQAHHFNIYASEQIPYAKDRYRNETRRLYSVVDSSLTNDFLVGNRLTIADIAIWPWITSAKSAEVDLDEFTKLKAWMERLAQRPAFVRGTEVFARVAGADALEKNRAWILNGMKSDAEKPYSSGKR